MASLEIPFAIGEQCWHIGGGNHEETVVCPECVGTRFVTMTLGNGEQYTLDCRACSPGLGTPRGYIIRHHRGYTPTPFTPARVTGIDSERGVTYTQAPAESTCYTYVYASDLFKTREECEIACKVREADFYTEEEMRVKNLLVGARKDAAWSVHYWRSQVEKLERDLEAAHARLCVCKVRQAKKEAKHV